MFKHCLIIASISPTWKLIPYLAVHFRKQLPRAELPRVAAALTSVSFQPGVPVGMFCMDADCQDGLVV